MSGNSSAATRSFYCFCVLIYLAVFACERSGTCDAALVCLVLLFLLFCVGVCDIMISVPIVVSAKAFTDTRAVHIARGDGAVWL